LNILLRILLWTWFFWWYSLSLHSMMYSEFVNIILRILDLVLIYSRYRLSDRLHVLFDDAGSLDIEIAFKDFVNEFVVTFRQLGSLLKLLFFEALRFMVVIKMNRCNRIQLLSLFFPKWDSHLAICFQCLILSFSFGWHLVCLNFTMAFAIYGKNIYFARGVWKWLQSWHSQLFIKVAHEVINLSCRKKYFF
jgi:hypothetical protein